MTRIRVLSPVGVATRDMVTVPPLPESLVGRTVGFLDNRKANGGPGKHSAVVPNCTFSRAVSRPIPPI